MISIWLTLSALAASGDGLPEPLVAAVGSAYGKAVPRQAICVTTPRMPDGVDAHVLVVGVTQRHAGCNLLGLWADDAWVDIPDGAKVILGDTVSAAALEDWTRHVLLAFDQIDFGVPVASRSSGSGWTVSATFYQRRDARGGSLHTEGSFTFDRSGTLKSSQRDQGRPFTTRLVQTAYRVEGVDPTVVQNAIRSRGKMVQTCFDDAWASDLTVSGPTRLQWTIAGGRASAIGILSGDDDNPGLVSCYSEVLRTMVFPDGVTGTVVWSFTADRRPE
ncbi:MAG: hypothetical protein ACI8PZ_001518 [Myxococcota bacterium]|jgi:hypothetical protein